MISGKINPLNGPASSYEHYLQLKREIEVLEWRLLDLCHLKVLYEALGQRPDVREIEVDDALAYLERRAPIRWPIEQFRGAFYSNNDQGRWKTLALALGEIRFALEISPSPPEDWSTDLPNPSLH